uniref:uncharacterized protein LOC120336609 n=1 Tax=Styela clava TaxID=7725 RepID=UPI00193A840A|nr:uncharacterized protein LOC120336609 [Styela clava]
MQKSIGFNEIGKAEIGPEGGSIHFDDCFVTIPPGALNHPVLFKLNLQTDLTQFCPEDFVGITPVLSSSTPIQSHLPMIIRLRTWCRTKQENVIAYVAYMEDEDSDIKILAQKQLRETGQYISFETEHVSRLFVYIKTLFIEKVEFKVQPELFFNKKGKFRCIFSLDDETTKKEVFSEMNRAEYSPTPFIFNLLTVKCGNQISIKISAESYETTQNYTFIPVNKNGFSISEDLWKGNRKVIEFQVSPLPQPQELLDIKFELNLNGKTECLDYNLLWPKLDFIDEID